MEFELGLKITRSEDDVASADFHIAKDRSGPVFVSTETESMFILTAHLKGFKKEGITININENGTRITISGERLVHETVMRGWRIYKKEVAKRGFRRTFKIPNGVVLDKTKAKFAEEESSLKIYMPKLEKGIHGAEIEEVKDEEKGERGPTISEDEDQKEHKKEEPLEHRKEERRNMMDEMRWEKEGELAKVEPRKEIHRPAQDTDVDEAPSSKKKKKSPTGKVKEEEDEDTKPRKPPETKPPPSSMPLEGEKFKGGTSQPEHTLQTREKHEINENNQSKMEQGVDKGHETNGSRWPKQGRMDHGKETMETGDQGIRNGIQEASIGQVEQPKEKESHPPVEDQRARTTKPDADQRPNLFSPSFLMGSALIASIVAFVVGFIKTKKQ